MRIALRLLPGLWLALLVAAPLVLVGIMALSWQAEGVPPYAPPWAGEGINPENLRLLTEDPHYRDALAQSLVTAGGTALLCLLLAAPMGIAIARAGRWREALLGAVLLPFWTGFLIRIGAWIGLLRDEGWINTLLRGLGLTDHPLPLLYSDGAMLLGMVHAYLPFAVLPVFAAATRLDPVLEQAAADLGATPGRAFLTVTLPQLLPSLAAAFLLVFIPAAGEYVIPELLGPPDATLVGRVLFQEFFQNRDWPVAAALAVALLALLILPIILFQRLGQDP
ncbi:putrescine transport system permease protein [Roseomonas rosea]|jgi:putrescine transport system permease protein|uniref:Putrescine transport system permease protein n=1 Tax=Muricoccus roseus TaxID=198092 RepID=A0A1M6KFV7_9PROT|nr:ABC transporter permease [Roseomonas rosea]SHJ57808.1 putrescine transport system permease protein [Roseomonas rosea]